MKERNERFDLPAAGKKRGITCIVFDADDTLVDYAKDAERAFRAALCAVDRDSKPLLDACIRFDYGNWDKVGLADVHLGHVQAGYHALYRRHVADLFDFVEREYGLGGRAREAENAFWDAFYACGCPVEGAAETVDALKARYRVFAATNGLSGQRRRLSAFGLDGVFISEELGAIKPTSAFFSAMLAVIGEPPASCLMVGDSLASDVAGARAAGLPCVFFNRRGAACPPEVPQIASLRELPPLLEKGL